MRNQIKNQNSKNLLIFILYITIFVFKINYLNSIENINNITSKETISYILRIEFPNFIKTIPNLCAYYKGYAINFDENICLIRQENYINQIVLVVTPEINHKSEGNNIKYLERIENKPCRIFYITNRLDKSNSSVWDFQEENIENLPLRLPECSLVVLLDPNYIDGLRTTYNHKSSDYSSNKNPVKANFGTLIHLPKLIIKNDIKPSEINASMNYIWLAAFDSRAIHTKLKKRIHKTSSNNQDVIVSIGLLER